MGFAQQLRSVIDAAKGDAHAGVRRVALEMQRRMVMRTPVDTGRLRANFVVGIGQINRATDGVPGVSPLTLTVIALKQWKPGETIFLTNSLPYAHVVEFGLFGNPPGTANGPKTINGFSKQAPAGFVRITAAEFPAAVAIAVKGGKE